MKDFIKDKELYYEQFQFDWIYRILKVYPKKYRVNTETSKEAKNRSFD